MRENLLRTLWKSGGAAVNGWLAIPNSFSAETMAHQGWDTLTIDLQHGTNEMSNVLPMLQAISQTDVVPFVRVNWNNPNDIMRALDLGAYGIIVPLINNAKEAQSRNCKVVAGGNVTVVQGTPVPKAPPRASASAGAVSPRAEGGPEQRARDSDSRGILESELRKAETKLAEQQKEYNNGEPDKQGIEGRNYQRYLDRVNELKEGIARTQSDIGGLKREISRLPAAS